MPDRMYCRSCCYELTGLVRGGDPPLVAAESRCPECGRAFRADQPRTWQSLPRSPVMQFVFGRGGAAVVSAVMLAVAVWQSWLPRPDALDYSLIPVMRSWTMWRWFGDRYGIEHTRLAGEPIRVWYFADRATSIRAGRPGAAPAWEVRDLGDGVVRVSLFEPGCDYRTIIAAARRCQTWPDEVWRFSRGRHRSSAGAGILEGTWDRLVVQIADHFGLTHLPTAARGAEELYVLTSSEEGAEGGAEREVRRVSLDEARQMGLRVRMVNRGISAIGIASP